MRQIARVEFSSVLSQFKFKLENLATAFLTVLTHAHYAHAHHSGPTDPYGVLTTLLLASAVEQLVSSMQFPVAD